MQILWKKVKELTTLSKVKQSRKTKNLAENQKYFQ